MGNRWGQIRDCPGCGHPHAVGTTCWQCPDCRDQFQAPVDRWAVTPEIRAKALHLAVTWEHEDAGKAMEHEPPSGHDNVSVKAHSIAAELVAERELGLKRQERIVRRGQRGPKVKAHDLGRNVEVRAPMDRPPTVKVHPTKDPDSRIVLGMLGSIDTRFEPMGWIVAGEARRPEWLRGSAYRVPAGALHPLPLPEGA